VPPITLPQDINEAVSMSTIEPPTRYAYDAVIRDLEQDIRDIDYRLRVLIDERTHLQETVSKTAYISRYSVAPA
jgi:hypothetical protein